MAATAAYRGALATVGHASASLARTLETCSRLKGLSDDAALGLQAAGGLHHVIANHEQVLVRTLSGFFVVTMVIYKRRLMIWTSAGPFFTRSSRSASATALIFIQVCGRRTVYCVRADPNRAQSGHPPNREGESDDWPEEATRFVYFSHCRTSLL